MDADQRDIVNFLKTTTQFVSPREICRLAGGKTRPRQDPYWAMDPLSRLVEQGVVEVDPAGHYRFVRKQGADPKHKKWVSPHIKNILEKSGKSFTHVIDPHDE